MFWRTQTCSLSILLNGNYCDLQLQEIRWFVLTSLVVRIICHCQSWVMTIVISNSTTMNLSVRLRFRKKQFRHLPLPVNVPLRVRVWPWQLQDQPEHSTESLLWDWWILNDVLTLHCAMRISGIAVVSSIAIPETVSLSSLQFQVSHNTT